MQEDYPDIILGVLLQNVKDTLLQVFQLRSLQGKLG